MFIVLLKFSDNKDQAGELSDAHMEWLKQGMDDGVILLVSFLQPNMGGSLLAHNTSLEDLQSRVNSDPFVAAKVTAPEIYEISPLMADERLNFLLDSK